MVQHTWLAPLQSVSIEQVWRPCDVGSHWFCAFFWRDTTTQAWPIPVLHCMSLVQYLGQDLALTQA
jgi:hypothetical protein